MIKGVKVAGEVHSLNDEIVRAALEDLKVQLGDGSFIVGLANAVKAGAITLDMLDDGLKLSASVVDDLKTADALKPLSANQGKILKELIDIINGTGEGSTDKKITDAIAKLVDKAPENLDTLKEFVDWIENHGKEVAAIVDYINSLANTVAEEIIRAENAENEIKSKALHYKTLHALPTSETVNIGGKSVDGTNTLSMNIPAATTEKAGVMSAEDKSISNSLVRFSASTEIGGINSQTGKDDPISSRRRTRFYKFVHYDIVCDDAAIIAYLYDKDKTYLGYVAATYTQKSEIALQRYPTAVYVRFSLINLTSIIEDGKMFGVSVNDLQGRFNDYDIELNNIYGIFDDMKAVSPLFTIGLISSSTGENVEGSARRRTNEYYCLPLSLECSGVNLIVYCYDENKTYLGYIGTVENLNGDRILTEHPNTVYVRFSIIDFTSVVTGFATSDKSSFSQQLQDLEGKVNTKGEDVLSGKKWAVCGDSFSKGDFVGYDGVTSIETGKYAGKPMTYGYIIGNRCNMEIFDNARGGMTIANPADGTFTNSFTNPESSLYYQKIPEDVDYITLYYGINDSHHASQNSGTDGEDVTGCIPVGTINDTTNTSFYGAWNEVLEWLITNRPFAKIGILVSNGCDTPEYRTATIAIARKWGIPFIDLNGDDRTPMMLRSQNPDISSTAKAIRYAAQRVSETNGHPNPQAHEYESTFIENFLRSL